MNRDKKRRIEIMDELFGKGVPVTFMDIAEALNSVLNKCKYKTSYANTYGDNFRKDMKTIREMLDNPMNGIPAEMLRTAGGNRNRSYCYADPNFSIMPYLTYYYTNSDYKMLDKALELLRDTLPEDVFRMVEFSIKSHVEYEFGKDEKGIDYGENLMLKGRRWLPILYQSVNKAALKITYKPYEKNAYSYVFHPYLLKQYDNRWFVFGRINEVKKEYLTDPKMKPEDVNQDYWNAPLDRIENVEMLTGTPFIPRPGDYVKPFEEIVGVTNKENTAIEEVRFLVTGMPAHFIYTKPLHSSQVAHWLDDKTLDVKIKAKINNELKSALLSYAPDITILTPEILVEEHRSDLQKALKNMSKAVAPNVQATTEGVG